jgi:hypothetical protein
MHSIREISILKELHHQQVIDLREIINAQDNAGLVLKDTD